ncbi:hypothetical protein K2173_008862 [Erythroxylum novogranatense]|uniref:Uncharacterized protein n=1 Tax=Erythroxylum novogranatense TaxID=1862640 RepID=A0AAV8UAG0_9ROSI|nr:hypothetical protein K2173_008862 [Erythroxylum novogranatense]
MLTGQGWEFNITIMLRDTCLHFPLSCLSRSSFSFAVNSLASYHNLCDKKEGRFKRRRCSFSGLTRFWSRLTVTAISFLENFHR